MSRSAIKVAWIRAKYEKSFDPGSPKVPEDRVRPFSPSFPSHLCLTLDHLQPRRSGSLSTRNSGEATAGKSAKEGALLRRMEGADAATKYISYWFSVKDGTMIYSKKARAHTLHTRM